VGIGIGWIFAARALRFGRDLIGNFVLRKSQSVSRRPTHKADSATNLHIMQTGNGLQKTSLPRQQHYSYKQGEGD